jgi:hypothetical protein
MGWAVIALLHKDLGDVAAAEHYFHVAANTTFPPFYTWHEASAQDGSSAQGAPNFVTGAGGFLQAVINGYGGVRWEHPGMLTLRDPQPLPGSEALTLRGVHFLGARLDIVARDRGWTVALSSQQAESVPVALELVMEGGTEPATRLTETPVARKRGATGYVRRARTQSSA